MKKLFPLLLIVTALLTGCGSVQNTSEVFVVGLDDEYAPLGFRNDSGQIVGFDIDLAKEAAKRLGVTFEFKPIDWNDKERLLTEGEIDIIWNGFDITPGRQRWALFSKPYMENRQVILIKTGSAHEIRSEGDLAGKIVGAQAGSTSVCYVNDNPQFKNSFADFKTYPHFKAALQALDDGEIDALIADELLSRYIVNHQTDKFEIVDVTVGVSCEIGIGFRKDDVELRDRVQKVFDDMVKDGTAKRISEQWFKADLIKFRK